MDKLSEAMVNVMHEIFERASGSNTGRHGNIRGGYVARGRR